MVNERAAAGCRADEEETIMVEVTQADFDYFNGAVKKITTRTKAMYMP